MRIKINRSKRDEDFKPFTAIARDNSFSLTHEDTDRKDAAKHFASVMGGKPYDIFEGDFKSAEAQRRERVHKAEQFHG